jgi:sugar phosphate isomerase/epimerase
MNQPIGFQGFEIIPDLIKDWRGTWKKMAGFGYQFVDQVTYSPRNAPTLAALSPKQIREDIHAAGLAMTNCHFSFDALTTSFEQTMATARELRITSLVCAPGPRRKTAEDWKWQGEQLNLIGAKAKKEGLSLAYHNHEIEFLPVDGRVPYEILMETTDPALVKFQVDVGNLRFGGADPVHYLEKYAGRYWSLHVKDFAKGKASVPVGAGELDWKRIFAVGKKQGILSYVAEVGAYSAATLNGAALEPSPISILESFRLSYLFLKDVTA